MQNGMYGEIRLFAGDFAPENWLFCQGQQLQINQYPALFGVIGVTYGGDGRVTFNLPDLRGVVGIDQGQGAGLSPYTIGEKGGQASYTPNINQLSHSHDMQATGHPGTQVNVASGGIGNIPAAVSSRSPKYANIGDNVTNLVSMFPYAVGEIGNVLPTAVNILQPYMALNFIICYFGAWPIKP